MAGHCGIASNSSYSCACNSKGKPGRNANHSFSSTGQVRMSCHSDSISRYFIGNHGVYVPTLLLAHGLLKLHAGGLSGAGSHFNINAGRTDSPKMWKWKIAQDCGITCSWHGANNEYKGQIMVYQECSLVPRPFKLGGRNGLGTRLIRSEAGAVEV